MVGEGVFSLLLAIRSLLMDEQRAVDQLRARIMHSRIFNKVHLCRPVVGTTAPSDEALRTLQRDRDAAEREHHRAIAELKDVQLHIKQRRDRREADDPQLIRREDERQQTVTECQQRYRATSKLVTKELRRLSALALTSFPEVYHHVPDLLSFQDKTQGTEGLTLDLSLIHI